jgi:hypothetical protein
MKKYYNLVFLFTFVLAIGLMSSMKMATAMALSAADVQPTTHREAIPFIEPRVLAAGIGAIGGMTALNYLTGGMGGVLSTRLLAITSVISGALVGDYLYRRYLVKDAVELESIPLPERK